MSNPYYLTTTLPYVNARPHLGHALEFIQADAIVRYRRLLGDDVVFNTGVDEHGLKIYRKAQEAGQDPQTYCDEYATVFRNLKDQLQLSWTHFIRTTDPAHKAAAQEFWKRCEANGDIYKKNYQVKYCVGCELEKTDSELEDGQCPIHPTYSLEVIDEENYFFRFSKYQDPLLKLYAEHPNFVVPDFRLQEIRSFVASGLEDFSISRLREKMPWGVPVPGDDAHVMYVWFDALINYISTLGWPESDAFSRFWPGVQVAGKDNLRQQSAMWQAMLLSAGVANSTQIFIHGFITSGGQKMSKSIGNVIDPFEEVATYGVHAFRYFLLAALPAYQDGDYTRERFEEVYTADLANGIGNLTSRVLTMIEKYAGGIVPAQAPDCFDTAAMWQTYHRAMNEYSFEVAVGAVQKLVRQLDGIISEQKPWEKAKAGEDISALLYQLAEALRHIAVALLPVMPEIGVRILAQLGMASSLEHLEVEQQWGRLVPGTRIEKGSVLFPRLEK